MKKTLRYYQNETCQEIAKSWARKERPYASVMTGLGKSLIFAALTKYGLNKGYRVLQLVPRLELVEQNRAETLAYIDDKRLVGIVCGQLNKSQNKHQAVIAMASSFVNKRAISGVFDILLIDECHRMKLCGLDGQRGIYEKIVTSLLRLNPNMMIAGLTGTPYRLDQGELHEKSHKTLPFFTHKVYDTSIYPSIKRLINEGHLSHVETLNTSVHVDLNNVKMLGGDYSKDDAGVKFDAIIDNAVDDMRYQFEANDIKTAIIFCSTLTNAKHILNKWNDDSTMRIVCGDDAICTKQQRKAAIDWIKNGTGCRYIVNVDILAEGFDFKALECCVLMRATKSAVLMVQMVGRIIRPHDDKEHAFLLDYGTNIERLGEIDNIIMPKTKMRAGDAPKKLCGIKDCGTINILSAKKCKECGAEFISESEDGLYTMRTKAQALAIKQSLSTNYEINSISYELAYSKKDSIEMIKMKFYGANGGEIHTHYLCLDHKGFAGDNAKRFFMSLFKNAKDFYKLGNLITCQNALILLTDAPHFFKEFLSIDLVEDGKFFKIVRMEFSK